MNEAILFSRCLGINDIKAFASQETHPDPKDDKRGQTELLSALNVTTTVDGAVEKIPGFSNLLTHTAPITNVSGEGRLFFQDATNTYEWTGAIVNRFSGHTGPVCHTPIDARVATATKVYRSNNSTPTAEEALVGTDPDPLISRRFYQMPVYKTAFVYNAHLYAVNKADPRFLQYSKAYGYDLWNLGDDFFPFKQAILSAGSIVSEKTQQTGCILCLHDGAVSVLDGSGPADFTTKFYPCEPIDNTLYSGFISKAYGYGHVFLCKDGVYMVNPDGVIANLTIGKTNNLGDLNTSYHGAVVQGGKYLAFGNSYCVEYDFQTKAVMRREGFSITSVSQWNGNTVVSTGDDIVTIDSTSSTTDDFGCSITMPYSTFGVPGAKSISDMYFTGNLGDGITITATDNEGHSWSKDYYGTGVVYNYRLQTPRRVLGNHISISISASGAFRLEGLSAQFTPSYRVR